VYYESTHSSTLKVYSFNIDRRCVQMKKLLLAIDTDQDVLRWKQPLANLKPVAIFWFCTVLRLTVRTTGTLTAFAGPCIATKSILGPLHARLASSDSISHSLHLIHYAPDRL